MVIVFKAIFNSISVISFLSTFLGKKSEVPGENHRLAVSRNLQVWYLFVFIVIYRPFCQVFRMYQTYWVELAICVYRHLPTFFSCFVCTRLTVLNWLFVFIVIYRSFCQVFRMYQTYCVELTICVYRHLPTFLSSFWYVPDLLGWVGYLCLSSFTDFFQFFRMYQTYCVEMLSYSQTFLNDHLC